MDSIILHISDLHVSLANKIGGEANVHDSYLDTSNESEPSFLFIEKFVEAIKRDYKIDEIDIYLLITGDITNEGEKKEFEYANLFLTKIIETLKIEINNILLIPGDHDLNRRAITNLLDDKEDSSRESVNVAKFTNFKDFYEKTLDGKKFDSNKVIFDTIEIDNSFFLLGLNSCTTINLIEKLGKIPILQFEEELLELNIAKKMIACVHHNFTSSYDNSNDGQWDPKNREFFIQKLLSNGIEFIFTGNEHTNSCKTIMLGQITTSDSGCFSSKSWDTTFKIYEVQKDENIVLKNVIYSLDKPNINDFKYVWDIRNNKNHFQQDLFRISQISPPQIEDEITDIPSLTTDNEEKGEENIITKIESCIYYSDEFTDKLYEKVKELKLFHTGHFHWSETSRAHNWIDVSKLIENKDNLSFLKNAIVDVIEDKNLEDVDLIIGLGYEGNIISSKAAIKYNKPYSFLPYSYRHDEHHEFENELNFNNEDGNFKKVLIITDVVNDGRTIRKLINKGDKQKAFFKNVENVYVVSLFYTGSSDLNNNILNYDFIKTIENYDIEKDEEVNNIEFYTVKSLKVEKCPYDKNFRKECLIVKDNLGCVNLFYDESKYL